MSLATLLDDFRAKVEPIIGITGLSNPSENIADPLVQVVIHALGGQAELERRLDLWSDRFDVRTAACNDLYLAAALVGEYPRSNQPSRVEIIFTGSTQTVPANASFRDQYLGVWTLESPVNISGGIGFGIARSAIGDFSVMPGELQLVSQIAGVNIATSGMMASIGSVTESCEQFRARLLSGNRRRIETDSGVLSKLLDVADSAKIINDAPECISPYSRTGFVVRGGDDSDIATIIRQYAPLNYARLAGNVSVNVAACETVRFIRPCPVGLEINYWGKTVADSDFI